MNIRSVMTVLFVLCVSTAVAQEQSRDVTAFTDTVTFKPVVMEGENGLYLNTLPGFSHKAVANQKCSNCHVEQPKQAQQEGAHNIAAIVNAYDAAFALDVGAAPIGLELGAFRVEILHDEILRGHLRLDREPALLVRLSQSESDEGLLKGDIILKIGGNKAKDPIATRSRLIELRDSGEQKRVEIEVIRAGKRQTLEVLVAELTPPQEPLRIGVQLEAPSEALRSQLQLFENEGAIVTNVIEDSPAEKVGIQEHDILLRADDSRLSNLEDLREAVQASNGKPIHMVVMRAGKEVELDVVAEREDTQPQLTWCPGTQFNLQSDGVRWFVSPESNSFRPGYYFDPNTNQPNVETWSRIYLDDYSARFADLIEEERILEDGKDSGDEGKDSDGFKDKKKE